MKIESNNGSGYNCNATNGANKTNHNIYDENIIVNEEIEEKPYAIINPKSFGFDPNTHNAIFLHRNMKEKAFNEGKTAAATCDLEKAGWKIYSQEEIAAELRHSTEVYTCLINKGYNSSDNSIWLAPGSSVALNDGTRINISDNWVHWVDKNGANINTDSCGALDTLIRIANGQVQGNMFQNSFLNSSSECSKAIEILNKMGIDTTNPFSINGVRFKVNDKGLIQRCS